MTLADKRVARPTADMGGRSVGTAVPYDADLYGWALQQAEALRSGRLDSLDVHHIAGEIDDVVHYLEDKLRGDLMHILQHLLKWDHQPERRSRSWVLTIREHRRRVDRHLTRAPGLRAVLPVVTVDAFASARDAALDETGLPDRALPALCPYAWDEITSRPIEWLEQP